MKKNSGMQENRKHGGEKQYTNLNTDNNRPRTKQKMGLYTEQNEELN